MTRTFALKTDINQVYCYIDVQLWWPWSA